MISIFFTGVWNAFLYGLLIAGSVVSFLAGLAIVVFVVTIVGAAIMGMVEGFDRYRVERARAKRREM